MFHELEGVSHARAKSESHPRWESRELEARLLAGLLRLSRVSVLYGEAGAGKTTLLFTGVLPLLHRRADDSSLGSTGHASGLARFPERRRRSIDSPHAELVFFFNAWNDQPLAALRKQICAALSIEYAELQPARALADDLAAWSKEFGVRFLILLDGFEQYLSAPADRQDIEQFAREFSQAVTKPQLAAHFLISVRDDAERQLDRLRTRIAGFDNSSFRLPPPHRAPSVPDQTTAAQPFRGSETNEAGAGYLEATATEQSLAASAVENETTLSASDSESAISSADAASYVPGLDGTPPDIVGRLQGTPARSTRPIRWLSLASYQSYLARFARPPRVEATTVPDSERANSTIAAVGANEADPVSATTPEPSSSVVTKTRQLKWFALPLVCAPLLLILCATIVYSPLAERLQSRAPAEAAETPRLIASDTLHTPAAVRGLPRIGFTIDADNATDVHIAHDLRRVVAPDAGLELIVQPGPVLFSKNSLPGLAVMRYESLQILRTIKNPAEGRIDGLRVLMPLYTEEIYFIVRRDSPLAFIHQIQGARINVGIERSSRRWTVERLYGAMFDVAVPAANMNFLRDEEALKNLVYDRTVDVVVVVAGQPAKLLSTLAPKISGSIKLLKLDPQHAASRRAIDVYLPATVRAANYRAWVPEDTATLATMAFLVSTGDAPPDSAGSLEMFAQSFCRKLPLLRRDGHPKWREVQPGLEIDVGWAYSAVAKTALQTCEANNPAGASVVRR
ncbi:MAG: uncharacterized protein V7640_2864 [Betaproteobacteria bacterium]